MKTIKPILVVCIVILLQLLMSCFPEHGHKDLRIKAFVWETVRYQTEYTHRGLLNKLKARDRSIMFYYDENQKLYKAEVVFPGSSSPESVFEYVQGPKGITRITWFRGNPDHGPYLITDFTYAEDGAITKIANSSSNRHILTPTYLGDNVSTVMYGENKYEVEMRAGSFDHKISPFHLLAKSVNNPAFFPVGYYVVDPLGDYNLPYINWLSANNPRELFRASRDIVDIITGGPWRVSKYPLSYVYQHDLVTKMTWGDVSDAANFKIFEFEYGLY